MIRRHLTIAVASIALVALSTAAPASVAAANPSLDADVVQSGLVNPWDIGFLPGGQMIVTERPGRVRIFASGGIGAALLGTTTLNGVHAQGESGVMGLAVDHLFERNRLVYICVSRDYGGKWVNQLIRYKVTASWTLRHERNLISYGMKAANVHNGCAVEEGPDQKIWLTMGDASDSWRAQDPNLLNGKVLRIGRDGSIPVDNPILPGASGRSFVYSMGHRNPQGIAFRGGTSRTYVIEHGPEVHDEINWMRAGLNYGWPCKVGFGTTYQASECSGSATYTNPRWSSGGVTWATSGGAFVSGTRWESFAGNLFVTTLKEQDLRRFTVSSTGGSVAYQDTRYNAAWGRLRAAVNGPANRLYLSTSNGSSDKIIRITPGG